MPGITVSVRTERTMSVKRNGGPKDALVNDIVDREWAMFQRVENIGGRAFCQDQYDTFYVNRYSQHSVLAGDTLESYRRDLADAEATGRNLVTEKYAYMMEFTDPAYFAANLKGKLPVLDPEKADLVARIVSTQLVGYQAYAARYPSLAGAGRPAQESGIDTSIRDYSVGEYKTYSAATLRLVLRDISAMENPVMAIQRIQVSFYGFADLEAAERAQRG